MEITDLTNERHHIANLIYSVTCIQINPNQIFKRGGRWFVKIKNGKGNLYAINSDTQTISVSDMLKRNFVKPINRFSWFKLTPVGYVSHKHVCICVHGVDILTYEPKFKFVIRNLQGRNIKSTEMKYGKLDDHFISELSKIQDIMYPAEYQTSPKIEYTLSSTMVYIISSQNQYDMKYRPYSFLN